MLSYFGKEREIWINTWVGTDGLRQTKNFINMTSLVLKSSMDITDQQISVGTISHTTEIFITIPDAVYVIRPLLNKIALVYSTNKYVNLAVFRITENE